MMRGSAAAARRLFTATVFALLAGAIVAVYNPVDHVKADLRGDAHGVKPAIEAVARTIEKKV